MHYETPTKGQMKAVAPSPPVGVTTLTGLAAMIVGVVVEVLSLFDVVPTDEDVQALGTVVGAVLFVVPYVVTAVSRTKQATNLAKIAQGERLAANGFKAAERKNAPLIIAPAGANDAQMRKVAEATGGVVVPSGSVVDGAERKNWSAEFRKFSGAGRRSSDTTTYDTTPRDSLDPAYRDEVDDDDDPQPLGAPLDKSLEVPGGGPKPADDPADVPSRPAPDPLKVVE